MPYDCQVYRILIATPSDVAEEREVITNVIQNWNDLYSYTNKIVLLPLKWETHTTPTMGDRPQEVINRTIVDECDLLIGCFWTRIGTPTGVDESGTLEEIKRVSSKGKEVMLYFSKRGQDPSLIDISQLEKLNNFKEAVMSDTLIESYNSIIDFREKLLRQLEIKVREIKRNTQSSTLPVSTGFISIENGKMIEGLGEIKHSAHFVDKEEVQDIIKQNFKYENNKKIILDELSDRLQRMSTIPIVLGFKNLSSFSLNNIIIDVTITSSNEDIIILAADAKNRRPSYGNSLPNYVNDEIRRKLINLRSGGELKKVEDSWNFYFSTTIIPSNETKIIKPFIFIRTEEDCNIRIKYRIESDGFIEPLQIEDSLTIKIEKKKNAFKQIINDIDEVIRFHEDIPF